MAYHNDYEWLTPPEYADLFRISVGTVRRHCRDGRVPAVRVGTQWRIAVGAATTSATSRRGARPVTGRLK